jgi:predicted TIM-barrel enzyme
MEIAKREIEIMYRNGVNAVLVENYFGDETDVENALRYLQDVYPDQVFGVNMLGYPDATFELARKYGAKFVQIDSVCGHALPQHDAYLAKYPDRLRGERDIFLLGGVRFKYTSHLSGRSLEEDLKLGMERCDAIVVTGAGTGISTDLEKIKTFRTILGDFPLIIGAGMTVETAKEQLAFSDGGIVGSYFKEFGEAEHPVVEARVKEFMRNAQA